MKTAGEDRQKAFASSNSARDPLASFTKCRLPVSAQLFAPKESRAQPSLQSLLNFLSPEASIVETMAVFCTLDECSSKSFVVFIGTENTKKWSHMVDPTGILPFQTSDAQSFGSLES